MLVSHEEKGKRKEGGKCCDLDSGGWSADWCLASALLLLSRVSLNSEFTSPSLSFPICEVKKVNRELCGALKCLRRWEGNGHPGSQTSFVWDSLSFYLHYTPLPLTRFCWKNGFCCLEGSADHSISVHREV